jgi:hypothetical protein
MRKGCYFGKVLFLTWRVLNSTKDRAPDWCVQSDLQGCGCTLKSTNNGVNGIGGHFGVVRRPSWVDLQRSLFFLPFCVVQEMPDGKIAKERESGYVVDSSESCNLTVHECRSPYAPPMYQGSVVLKTTQCNKVYASPQSLL